jgi:hypothetical protein
MSSMTKRRSMLLWSVMIIGASCDLTCGITGPIPSCSGKGSSINTTFSYEPEVACPGSTVTVKWDGAGVVPTITAPGGAVISNGQSAGSGTFQATTSGNISVSVSGATKTFPFEVATTTSINLIAQVAWNGSLYTGQTPATFPAYDAKFQAKQLTTKRLQVLVSHLNGSAVVGTSPTPLVPAWKLNGVWSLASGAEATDNVGPSAIGVTATLTCVP